MSATIKSGISIAKRRMMARMVPVAQLVAEQRARLVKIDERLGRLMSQRANEEEILTELIMFERNPQETK